jgi:diguanylate cyclase (GGDEF)-like protein
MSIRFKVLIAGVSMVLISMIIMAFYIADHERAVHTQEVENRARVLLAALSAPCVSALAQNRIEDLDRVVEEFRNRMEATAGVRSVAVLDGRRRVMGHTEKSMYGRLLSDPFVILASEGNSSAVQYHEEGGHQMMLVAYPLSTSVGGLPGIRWGTLIAKLDLSWESEVLMRLIWRTMKVMLLFALLTALLLYFMAERLFLRPVLKLSSVAKAVGGGDLGARANLKGKSEVARLGQSFDGMAAELERHTHDLQELVMERTDELGQANKELVATMAKLRTANSQLEQLARTDALTGLPNVRHLKEALPFYFELARRGDRPLSFAMIDVDHFKHYNDTQGHPAGDIVLQELAKLFLQRVRQTDIACRYGGEEFAVLFLDTTIEEATLVAETLRRKVAYHEFPFGKEQPEGCLSVSIGVAELTADMLEPMDLVTRADQALYAAKHAGRNRVATADGPHDITTGSDLDE